MPVKKWNEIGRVWEDDHGMLDQEQVAKCERADVAELLQAPIPTRMISNGEYMPVPQTEQQKRVEARRRLRTTPEKDRPAAAEIPVPHTMNIASFRRLVCFALLVLAAQITPEARSLFR